MQLSSSFVSASEVEVMNSVSQYFSKTLLDGSKKVVPIFGENEHCVFERIFLMVVA